MVNMELVTPNSMRGSISSNSTKLKRKMVFNTEEESKEYKFLRPTRRQLFGQTSIDTPKHNSSRFLPEYLSPISFTENVNNIPDTSMKTDGDLADKSTDTTLAVRTRNPETPSTSRNQLDDSKSQGSSRFRHTWSFRIKECYFPNHSEQEDWKGCADKLTWNPLTLQNEKFKSNIESLRCCLDMKCVCDVDEKDRSTSNCGALSWIGEVTFKKDLSQNQVIKMLQCNYDSVKFKRPGKTFELNPMESFGKSYVEFMGVDAGENEQDDEDELTGRSTKSAARSSGKSKRTYGRSFSGSQHTFPNVLASDDQVYADAFNKPNLHTALTSIRENKPAQFVLRNTAITNAFIKHFVEPIPSIYKLDSFRIPGISQQILDTKSIILYGRPRTGKTEFAKAHFNAPAIITNLEDIKKITSWEKFDGIIFDETAFGKIRVEDAINLFDRKMDRSIRVLYKTVVVPGHLPKIFTTYRQDGMFTYFGDHDQRLKIRSSVHFLHIGKVIYHRELPKPTEATKISSQTNKPTDWSRIGNNSMANSFGADYIVNEKLSKFQKYGIKKKAKTAIGNKSCKF